MNIQIVKFNPQGDGSTAIYINGKLKKSGDYYHDKIDDWISGWLSGLIDGNVDIRVTCADVPLQEETEHWLCDPPETLQSIWKFKKMKLKDCVEPLTKEY
jgi:hypothetical protein